jgi:hypothetical protein
LKLAIGKFACFCIDARLGGDIAAGVQLALRHYGRRLKSGQPPVRFPDFCRDLEPERSAPTFDLPIDSAMQAMIGKEARRHAVSVDQIATHAVFVYLADLDSGASAA